MILSDLKPQHQTTVIGQVLENKATIEYLTKEVLLSENCLEEWEEKEYRWLLSAAQNKLKDLRQYLIDNKAHFNDFLSQYKMCVPMFINLEILPYINNY